MRLNVTPAYARRLLVAGLALVLSACSADHADLQAEIDRILAREGQPIEPLPPIRPAPSYVYVPGDRRSPFVPDAPAQVAAAPDSIDPPDQDRPREPLEEIPLDSFRMVGTLGAMGLVQDPQGRVHMVSVGDHMGFDYGRITGISEGAIDLIEIVSDGRGGWRERDANISIPQNN